VSKDHPQQPDGRIRAKRPLWQSGQSGVRGSLAPFRGKGSPRDGHGTGGTATESNFREGPRQPVCGEGASLEGWGDPPGSNGRRGICRVGGEGLEVRCRAQGSGGNSFEGSALCRAVGGAARKGTQSSILRHPPHIMYEDRGEEALIAHTLIYTPVALRGWVT